MYSALHRALHSLFPVGPGGFEGFVHSLIGRITGRNFFLAKAGSQGGKDSGTAGYGGTYVDIECKRNQKGASPSIRELFGELREAIDRSEGLLDLWLLVTSGSIGSSEAEALCRAGNREGVGVEIIDWQEAGLPQLAILCAAVTEETLEELRRRDSDDLSAVAADLRAVAADPRFEASVFHLHRRLSAADLGYDHARRVANEWIEVRLASKTAARAAFNQFLCVGDSEFQPYVDRPLAQAALQGWYESWASNPSTAAVLGREGTGKSWAAMNWWRRLDIKPLTLLATSNREIPNSALSLVASQLLRQTDGTRDLEFWKRCIRRWLRRPPANEPSLLLILDGLNERPRQEWDRLFASLAEEEWKGHLAVLATSRVSFWSERVEQVLRDDTPLIRVQLHPFSDDELASAWGDRRPLLVDLPTQVREFIRTPRTFRVARHHVEKLMEGGDLTVERLLIEDWSDRRKSKAGFAHTETEFNDLIIGLARDLRSGFSEFDRARLREHSSLARASPDRNLDRDFDEIIDGQLFERADAVSTRYQVRPEYAGLALGMLLAREIRDEHRHRSESGVDALLATTLDPVADLDQTSAILRGAFIVACFEHEYPAYARLALGRAWLHLPNAEDAQWREFAAHLPQVPDTFFDLAEDLWCAENFAPKRHWTTDAILRWSRDSRVQEQMVARCRRWLGLWHPDWHPFLGQPTPDYLARQRQVVGEHLSRMSDVERSFAEEAPTSRAPFIARLAITLISHGPRAPHIEGILAWAISRALMGIPSEIDDVAWCLRLNNHDPAEAESALLATVGDLLEAPSEVAVRAARNLLWACGTAEAAERLAALPAPAQREYPPRTPLIDVDPLDPAAAVPEDLGPATSRLAELDPSLFWAGLGITAEQHKCDDLEPILTRFAPKVIAAFYQRLLRSASERQGMPLRQLGWRVPENLLLIGPAEASRLDQARRSLFRHLGSDLHDARATEAYLLLGLLPRHAAERQIDLLLDRPEKACDLLRFEEVIATARDEIANAHIARLGHYSPTFQLRRLLWVLSCHPFILDDAARTALIRSFSHFDPLVRANAFRLALRCNDRDALRAHATSEWVARSDETTPEAFYGSLALVAGAGPGEYQALKSRVAKEHRGDLVLQDGTPSAIDNFADDIDEAWKEFSTPGISQHIPFRAFPRQGLSEAIARRPELAEKWVKVIADSETVPWAATEFYQTLCVTLGADHPDWAAQILTRLRSAGAPVRVTYRPMMIDVSTHFAFELASGVKVDSLRDALLDEANTDELLFQFTLAAQARGATEWLGGVIYRDLAVPSLRRRARSLTIIGFLDQGALFDALVRELDTRTGFLEQVSKSARNKVQQNTRARAWFREFLMRRDPVDAWGAFRLFLRCVDRRFWLWRDAMLETTPDLPTLWRQHLHINDQAIDRAVKKNEGKLSDTLFAVRTSRHVAPWHHAPPLADMPERSAT